MRRGPELGLGHADDRNAELSEDMSAQAGPTAGVQVNIAINNDQCEPASCRDNRPQPWMKRYSQKVTHRSQVLADLPEHLGLAFQASKHQSAGILIQLAEAPSQVP